jgi:hypothetical protein
VNVKEHFLDEILRFGFVPENSFAYIPDGSSVTAEKQGKGLAVTCLNSCDERLIRGFG